MYPTWPSSAEATTESELAMTAVRLQSVQSLAELTEVPGARDFLEATSELLESPCDAILHLSLRQGMHCDEIAEVVELHRLDAASLVAHVEARFDDLVKARVVWRGGHPRCRALTAESSERRSTFDAGAANRILSHLRRCAACYRDSQLAMPPCAMYAGMPPERTRPDHDFWEPRLALRTYR